MEVITQLAVNGFLMGLVYSLIAVGLTLIWGVMDLTNFAHAQFMMVGMYATYWLYTLVGLDPLLSLPVVFVLMFVFGLGVYRLLIRRVVWSSEELSRVLLTFAVGLILSNGAMLLWTPNFRSIPEVISSGVLMLGVRVSIPRLVAAAGSVLVSIVLHLFLRKTRIGRALQAVSMDRQAAMIVGVNVEHIFALAFGIGIGCAGLAGCFLSNFMYIYPDIGAVFILLAFAVVALGGLGSVPGALIGGVIVGLVESLGGFIVGPAFKYGVVFLVYLGILVWRPKGLMGW